MDNGPEITPLNQWVFVSAVWHASTNHNQIEFYVNGGLNSSSSVQGDETASGTAHLELGNFHSYGAGSVCFGGYLRDIGVYNRTLSASEIGTNFISSEYITNVSYPDLLYYKLNTGSALTNTPQYAYDTSTIGTNTGTIYGINGSDIEWTNGITKIPDDTNGLNGPNNYEALHFHGAGGNYIDTGNSNLFQLTTNLFTINFWVAPYTPGETIMQCGVYKTNGWYIACGGSYQIIFGTETNGFDTNIITGAGNSGAQVNIWTMVTVVRSSLTNATIYINGFPEVSGPVAVPAPSTTALQIGISPGATANSFDGDMWGIQIWSKPLTQIDIANLYWATGGTQNTNNYP